MNASDFGPRPAGDAKLLAHLPHMVWRSRDDGAWSWVNSQWSHFTGQSHKQSLGHGWLAAVHPDDRARARRACCEPGDDDRMVFDLRIWNAQDGRHHLCQAQSICVRDASGAVLEWYGDACDFDGMHQLHSRQQALVSELQHRVRNILSVVRSIARRTAEGATSVEDYAAHLEGRINAMARAQTMLARSAPSGLDLEAMVAEELLAHAVQDSQLHLQGPAVHLPPPAAEAFCLAIHELAANAVKYGALSQAGAQLSVTWTVDTHQAPALLTLIWREAGVTVATTAPRKRGFGFELLERSLPYDLGAQVGLQILPGGLCCTISTPLNPPPCNVSFSD
ncbi:MAG: HWE histidine kinase domain-containing protein [Rhizorhabdus sp.]